MRNVAPASQLYEKAIESLYTCRMVVKIVIDEMFHAIVSFPLSVQLVMEVNFVVYCVNKQAKRSWAIRESI